MHILINLILESGYSTNFTSSYTGFSLDKRTLLAGAIGFVFYVCVSGFKMKVTCPGTVNFVHYYKHLLISLAPN